MSIEDVVLTLGLCEVDGAVGLVGCAGRLLHQLHVAHGEGRGAQVQPRPHLQPFAARHRARGPLRPVGDGALRVRLKGEKKNKTLYFRERKR